MTWTEADPGQGDPDGLLTLARDLQGDADDAAAAARTLRSVQHNAGDAVWKGSSADAFRERINKLPSQLDKLNASYADAAASLRGYAASVRQIASEARVQQQDLQQSQDNLTTAQAAQAAWTPPPHPVTGQPDPAAKNPHDEQVATASASIRKAQARLHELAGQRQTADGRLVGALQHAHGEGMHNKHWWQKALDFVSDALAKITIVLMVVALVAVVVLAIVQPELIPGLLLLAGQVLTGLSAAQLAVDGTRKATGENVSWGTLGLDAFGLLPGIGRLGKFADATPLLSRGTEALRGASQAVRGYGAAGGAFARSLATDLRASRYLVRIADTGAGTTFMAGIERQGKTAGEMLTDAKAEASAARHGASTGQPPPVHEGKQGKHIPGHNNYDPRKSTLSADPAKLAERAGTGEPVGSIPRGQAGFKERIDFGEDIGVHVGEDGTRCPTTVGILVYAKDGSIHIIPARPAE